MALFYKTQRNYDHSKTENEVNHEPSETVQNDVKPIKEILKRALAGIEPDAADAIYFDEPDIDKISRYHAPHALDLTDLVEMRQRNEELRVMIEAAQAKKEAALAEEAAEQAAEEAAEEAAEGGEE